MYLAGVFENDETQGIFWSCGAEPEIKPRQYYYIKADNIDVSFILPTEEGVFLGGQRDGEMLLLRLTHQGIIQEQFDLGPGELSAITPYEDGYLLAGIREEPFPMEPNGVGPDGHGRRLLYLGKTSFER